MISRLVVTFFRFTPIALRKANMALRKANMALRKANMALRKASMDDFFASFCLWHIGWRGWYGLSYSGMFSIFCGMLIGMFITLSGRDSNKETRPSSRATVCLANILIDPFQNGSTRH